MPLSKSLIIAILPCILISTAGLRAATPEDVDRAVSKGVAWIYAHQTNGNWEQWSGLAPFEADSLTAFAAYTLLCARENPNDPRIATAIEYLLKRPPSGTYGAALRCLLWSRLGLTPQIRPVAEKDVKYLLSAMKTQAPSRGLFSYTSAAPSSGDYDLSCSQFAVLGLWSAAHAGIEIPAEFWKIENPAWCGKQLPDGSWFYGPAEAMPTASMTAAGVASLLIADEQMRLTADCRGNPQDPNVDKGIEWLSSNFDHVFEPKYQNAGLQLQWYTFFGLSRIGVLSGQKYFGKYDWYAEASDRLLAAQLPDGSWGGVGGGTPVAVTVTSVASLCYGSGPVVINKLQYALPPEDGKPVEGRWNQRPRDMTNYVDWMMRQLEGRFNWQQLNLASASVDDLHEAPIVYISGDQDLQLSPDDRAKLKLFAEQGGLIVGNPDCQRDRFIQGFKSLGTEMFPEYKFRELPETHVLLSGEEFPARKWRRKIQLMGLSNGVRELMLIPDADLSRAFQTRNETVFPESYQLLDDSILYAVDKTGLSTRGSRRLVKLDASIAPTRSVKLSRLQYAGNWDPEPEGWRRLSVVLHNTQKTALEIETVKLGEGRLSRLPVEVGTPPPRPTLAEIRQTASKRITPEEFQATAGDPVKIEALVDTKVKDVQAEFDAAEAKRLATTATCKLAHLTGTGQIKLTDAEQLDLKKFVEAGGTVIIDAAGGSTEFAASVEQMLTDTFGADAAQIQNPLPPDAPMYRLPGRAVDRVQYRNFARTRISHLTMPQLRGIQINGRTAIIYSREDLSAGLVGEPVDGITGYTPASATELMTDIILAAARAAAAQPPTAAAR